MKQSFAHIPQRRSFWNQRAALVFVFVCFACLTALAQGCGGSGTGAKPGQAPREANLPLYFTVTGQGLGEGAIYRLQSLERGSLSTPELVVDGLDFPTGISVDPTGAIYVAEKLPAPHGKIKKIERESAVAEVLLTGLHNPLSVAVDSFNHVYVNEGDLNRITRSNGSGAMVDFKTSDIALPRDMLLDANDKMFLTELDGGTVSSIDPTGQRQVLVSGLANPFSLTLTSASDLYAIVNATGGADGSIVKIGDNAVETVLTGLINPIAITYNNAHGFFVIEGSPANRIINYSTKTGALTIVTLTGNNPYGIAMSPL